MHWRSPGREKLTKSVFLHPASPLQDGPVLREAVRRYTTLWLPLVKETETVLAPGEELAPPLDVAWLWHVHRLSPLGYHADCMSKVGKPLHAPAGTNPFAFTADEAETSPTRATWESLYPNEPFENSLLSGATATVPPTATPDSTLPLGGDAAPPNLHVDIISSVQRQAGFLWQARPARRPPTRSVPAVVRRHTTSHFSTNPRPAAGFVRPGLLRHG